MIFKQYAYASGSNDATFTGHNIQESSCAENINNILPYNYASFELNSINERSFIQPSEKIAYASKDLSDANGYYPTTNGNSNVQIDVTFNSAISIAGITFNSKPAIKEAKITAHYSNSSSTHTFSDVADNYVAFDSALQDVASLEIEIVSVYEANRFFNLFEVHFGKVFVFNESNIKDMKMINEISVSGRELPEDKLDLTLIDYPNDFLPDSKQKLEVFSDDGILKYTFYVDEFDYDEETLKITYLDVVSLLENDFAGGFYDDVYSKYTPTEKVKIQNETCVIKTTVKDIVDEIMESIKVPYFFDNIWIEKTEVKGVIPTTSIRNALIYIANATGYKWIKQPYLVLIDTIESKTSQSPGWAVGTLNDNTGEYQSNNKTLYTNKYLKFNKYTCFFIDNHYHFRIKLAKYSYNKTFESMSGWLESYEINEYPFDENCLYRMAITTTEKVVLTQYDANHFNITYASKYDEIAKSFDESVIFDDIKINTKKPSKQVVLKRYVQVSKDSNNSTSLMPEITKTVTQNEVYTLNFEKMYPPFLVQMESSLVNLNYYSIYDKKLVFSPSINATGSFTACTTADYQELEIRSDEAHIENYQLFPSYLVETVDFRLLNTNNLEAILESLLDYYSSKETITSKVIWQNPQIGYKVKFLIGGNEYIKTVKKITTSDLNDEVVEIEVE